MFTEGGKLPLILANEHLRRKCMYLTYSKMEIFLM